MSTASAAESFNENLESLKSFLADAQSRQAERLTRDEADFLEASIESTWPNLFRQRILAATWFLLGVSVAKYALGG